MHPVPQFYQEYRILYLNLRFLVCVMAWETADLTEERETDHRLSTYETAKKLNCTHVDRVNIMRQMLFSQWKRDAQP